jgi:hypothetical protein
MPNENSGRFQPGLARRPWSPEGWLSVPKDQPFIRDNLTTARLANEMNRPIGSRHQPKMHRLDGGLALQVSANRRGVPA